MADRPGHDRRYSLETSRIRRLGWTPETSLEEGLALTCDWIVEHQARTAAATPVPRLTAWNARLPTGTRGAPAPRTFATPTPRTRPGRPGTPPFSRTAPRRCSAGRPSPPAATPKRPRRPPPPAEPARRPLPPAPAPPDVTPFFKDTAPFIEHGNSLEARLEDMPGLITPNELFFVRNNGGSLGVRETDWRLVIEGDAVEKAIQVSYDGIRSLPPTTR